MPPTPGTRRALQRLRTMAHQARRELAVYRRLLADPETPNGARWLLRGAVAYLLLPFDLIPDWIPGLGQLDDLIVVPVLIWLALKKIPAPVLERARREAEAERIRRDPPGAA